MPVSYRDAAGHYLGCNAAFERLSGLRRDAIMGKALPSPFTGDDPVGDLPSESGPAARPGMLTREVTTLDADGHPRRGQLHAATFVDEGGAAEGIIEVFVDLSAQRALQEELTRSERRYRAMFDRSHAVMILVDPDTGTIVGANPAAVTYYGYSREEFIGKSIQEINVSPHQQIRDGMVRARTGSQGHFSWQHRLASGDVRTVDVYSGPVELDGRELLFSIVHDVTARRRTEEALRISEERFRIIAESVPDMIAILTPDGQFEYASPAFRVLGIESEALPGSPFLDIVETTDGPRVREALHEAERTLQSQSVEHQVRGVAGVTRIVETSVTVQIDDAGQRIITVSRDITERRRRDQIVRKLSSAVEHSPTSIIITDVRGTIEYVNPSFCRVTGYAPEEVIGRNPRLLKSGESMAEEYGRLWKTITSGQTWHGRFANRKKDGSIFWERATISPITGANGAITHFVAVKEDVSEQIRQEQERLDLDRELRKRNEALERMVVELRQVQDGLVQSEKMASIGQLTAGIAHEINNPLAFVASNLNRFSEYFEDLLALFRGWRGLAERLPGGPAEEAERTTLRAAEAKVDIPFVTEDFQRLMGHTREGTDRIKRIVEQLRGFTHLSGNGYVEANINDALEDTVMITWNELKYKTTVVRAYGEIPLVSCNVGELKQVFVNLLVNAAHAIPEKGEIRLATAAQGDQVVIEIQDTGGGIPATHLTKIFDPFFTTKPVGQGTGLGLWISATLVRKHRGTISVQSEVGKGTTFTITIPVQVKETLEATP
jgi:PAS domain S-box-containing protein